MKDETWTRDEPDSPCKKICIVHPEAKICIGCFRTAAEVRLWAEFTPEQRLQLLEELPQRSGRLKVRRGRRRRPRA